MPGAHAIISPLPTVSPMEDGYTCDGFGLFSDTLASLRGRYAGAPGFGIRTSRQTSASRPDSGFTACSTALRPLTEDKDDDRDCREGGLHFSLKGDLKEVEGGDVE